MPTGDSWEDARSGAAFQGWTIVHLGMLALVLMAFLFVSLTRTGVDVLLFLVGGLVLALIAHLVSDWIADSAGPGWALVAIAGLVLVGIALASRANSAGDAALRPVRKVLDWAAPLGYSGAIISASNEPSSTPISSHVGPAPGSRVPLAPAAGAAQSRQARIRAPGRVARDGSLTVTRGIPDQSQAAQTRRVTTTSLSASAARVREGETVSFTAAVRAEGAEVTGQVEFLLNGKVMARRSLRREGPLPCATFSTYDLPVGTCAIRARYAGAGHLDGSESITLTIQVIPPN